MVGAGVPTGQSAGLRVPWKVLSGYAPRLGLVTAFADSEILPGGAGSSERRAAGAAVGP